jgi:BarA-like signal transduction histidine kinase
MITITDNAYAGSPTSESVRAEKTKQAQITLYLLKSPSSIR